MRDKLFSVKTYLTVFLVLYTAYSALFIYKSSEAVSGKRYFILFDDMMISMRYAKNFADGNGLTWNPGREKVEGYTNLLWTLYMAVPHLLKYPASKTSLFIQISGWLIMVLAMLVVYKTSLLISGNNLIIGSGAVTLCGLYFSLTQWALIGTEVSLLALLVAVAVHETAVVIRDGRVRPLLYLSISLMVLTRMDMAACAFLFIVFAAVCDKERAKYHLLFGGSALVLILAGLTLFRVLYYHDILPNTYYLKMTGYPVLLRIARGLWSFTGMIARAWFLPFLLPLVFSAVIKDRMYRLIILLFLAQSAYSIYVGGDAWHNGVGVNRFIAVVMPVFFIAVSISVNSFFGFLKGRGAVQNTAFYAAIILLVFFLNFYQGGYSLRKALLLEPALDQEAGKRLLYESFIISDITEKDAVIGVLMAGVIPYFTGRECIDMLGKSEKYISRLPMQLPPETAGFWDKISFFYPGHLKKDHAYVIGRLKPDLFCGTEQIYNKYDTSGYVRLSNYLFLRKDSKKIKWAALGGLFKQNY